MLQLRGGGGGNEENANSTKIFHIQHTGKTMLKLTKLSVSKAACKYCFSIYIPPVTLQYPIKWRMCSAYSPAESGGYIANLQQCSEDLEICTKDTTTLSITSETWNQP